MYQALYRKWRPRVFDDVVGQEPITTTLKHQVASNRLSHAYLFCGSRGTGKTSCSKILAKAVNCLNPQDGNPCGVCEICLGIDHDSILDVTEIDAASNNGVDNIRDLREEATFTPVSAKYRVYIIDETHMLSSGAFNALLKIMEEPPPHVIFILATTEIHKVPATILSRCQRFDFRRIPAEIIAQRLEYIATQEQIVLAPQAALLIARLSDGAMRDSLSLLDLCMAAGTDIDELLVEQSAGLAGHENLFTLGKFIVQEDSANALKELSKLWEWSIDYQRFCEQLLGFYRNLLVARTVPQPDELIDASPQELKEFHELSDQYSVSRLFFSLDSLTDTLNRMARTPMRRMEMELGILKLCHPEINLTPSALLTRVELLEQQKHHSAPVPSSPLPNTEKQSEVPETQPFEKAISRESTEIHTKKEAYLFEDWQKVLDILFQNNKALHATLLQSSAYLCDDILLVDAGSKLFAEMINSDSYARNSLREAAQIVTGQKYRLGPYHPEQYEISATADKLDAVLQSAQKLGVEIEITE